MARRRPTPKDVPDALREAVDRTVQATIGSAQFTRGRAQDAVDELVRTAESRAGAVREAVRGALDDRRPASADDLTAVRRELRRISRRLDSIEQRLPAAPAARPSSRPAGAAGGGAAGGRAKATRKGPRTGSPEARPGGRGGKTGR